MTTDPREDDQPIKKPRGNPETVRQRAAGGKWLKALREAAGLTQREMAKLVGIKYWTFVSQLEIGEARIPPDKYRVWAETLGIDPAEFLKALMIYYEPEAAKILGFMDFDRPPGVLQDRLRRQSNKS